MCNIFQEARRLVSAREVAELNGFHPNRSGFICCPFHHERTPSLKLFPDGGWKCFGCGKGGSVIDFTAELFGLSPLDAVRRLNDNFHLGLPIDRQQTPQERTEAARAAAKRRGLSVTEEMYGVWRGAMLNKLTTVFRMAHLALKDCQTLNDLTEAEALAVKWQVAVEYWADCLLPDDMAVQIEAFRARGEVGALCERILNGMQTRSGAA